MVCLYKFIITYPESPKKKKSSNRPVLPASDTSLMLRQWESWTLPGHLGSTCTNRWSESAITCGIQFVTFTIRKKLSRIE